ncbi:MAG: hypothetical protein ACLFRY_11500 [Spirochaetia bacterium]
MLRIVYRNGKGEVSGRSIRVISRFGGRGGPVYIRVFCELRGEERTFRADRIISWSLLEPACLKPSVNYSRDGPREYFDPAVPGEVPPGPPRRKKKKRKWPALLAAGLIAWGIVRFHDEVPNLFLEADPAYTEAAYIAPPEEGPEPSRAAEAASAESAAREADAEGEWVLTSEYEALLFERAEHFIQATGIDDVDLLTAYAAADTDCDGGLSWRELEVFQELVAGTFAYAENSRALRPDEFLTAGEGDCEDFALFTAGLVRFWGGRPFIGVIRGSSRITGHAVCLVYTREKPGYPVYWTNDGSAVYPGIDLPEGYFVPVDYEHVGSLSNAVAAGWSLAEIMIPEETYGLPL